MTSPQQPGASEGQIEAANAAEREAGVNQTDPLLAPHYPAIRGQNLRGFGWDIDTGQSMPRGRVFPIGSFGHTGFTGTSVWIDPASDTYVVLLTNSIHTRGSPPASKLRGDVATAAARRWACSNAARFCGLGRLDGVSRYPPVTDHTGNRGETSMSRTEKGESRHPAGAEDVRQLKEFEGFTKLLRRRSEARSSRRRTARRRRGRGR